MAFKGSETYYATNGETSSGGQCDRICRELQDYLGIRKSK